MGLGWTPACAEQHYSGVIVDIDFFTGRADLLIIRFQELREGYVLTTFLDGRKVKLPYCHDPVGVDGLHDYLEMFPNEKAEAAAPWN